MAMEGRNGHGSNQWKYLMKVIIYVGNTGQMILLCGIVAPFCTIQLLKLSQNLHGDLNL